MAVAKDKIIKAFYDTIPNNTDAVIAAKLGCTKGRVRGVLEVHLTERRDLAHIINNGISEGDIINTIDGDGKVYTVNKRAEYLVRLSVSGVNNWYMHYEVFKK